MAKYYETQISLGDIDSRISEGKYLRGVFVTIAMDGVEQEVYKSHSKFWEQSCFSAKKGYHTFTKLAACSVTTGKIRFLSPSYTGSKNDLNVYSYTENLLHKKINTDRERIIADAGYRGTPFTIVPFVNIQNVPLTEEEDNFNKELSSMRIIIENVFGAIKKWKICAHPFRTKKFARRIEEMLDYHHMVWLCCAGLVNDYSILR